MSLSTESHSYLGCRDPDHISCPSSTGVQPEYFLPGILSRGICLINHSIFNTSQAAYEKGSVCHKKNLKENG